MVALDAFGTYVGYTHEWADDWRSTATYSRLHVENETSQAPFAFHQTQYASVNLKWAPSDVFWAGIEYLWGGQRDQERCDRRRVARATGGAV